MLNLGLVGAFASMMFMSLDVAIAKHLTNRLGKFRYSVGILGIGIIPMLIYALVVGIHAYSMEIVLLSLLAGAFLGTGYALYYKSLETEQVTEVSSIGEIQPALLLLFGVFILQERINVVEIAGIFAIFIGSFLILRTRGLEINRMMIPVIAANILWVVYWILMDYAITLYGGYSFPLLIARSLGFVLMLAYVLATGSIEGSNTHNLSRGKNIVIMMLITSGMLDSLMNISFGFVVGVGLVAMGSAILATSPMVIALFGKLFYKDRIRRLQKIGLVLAVAGAVAISIG